MYFGKIYFSNKNQRNPIGYFKPKRNDSDVNKYRHKLYLSLYILWAHDINLALIFI